MNIAKKNNTGNKGNKPVPSRAPVKKFVPGGSNGIVDINGIKRTTKEWAQGSGIKQMTIESRLNRGWNSFDAVFKPVKTRETPVNEGDSRKRGRLP